MVSLSNHGWTNTRMPFDKLRANGGSFTSNNMQKIEVEELLNTARQRTGLSDFGPPDFMEGLTVLADGVNQEAQISDAGWAHVRERWLNLLINRLWFAQDMAQHPEILDEDLGAPTVIASLPRTGSTKLHRMLAATGDFQNLFMWSTHKFARIPGMEDGGRAQRIQQTRDYEKWLYETSPALVTGHPLYTDEAEEDQFLVECTFRHPLLFGMFQSFQYAQWIMQADMQPTFDSYLKQLKYLQWQSPSRRGKPWLVKTPNHMGNEEFLTRVFNQPKFIVTHRDPLKAVPSVTNTAMVMRKLFSDYDSSAELGAGCLELFSNCANVHMKWRDRHPEIEVLDLAFREITQDGISAVRKVYGFLGMELSARAIKSVAD